MGDRKLVKRHLASTVSSFILFRPVLGFILAFVFLHEPLNKGLFFAASIIGFGVFLIFQGQTIFSWIHKRLLPSQ